MKQLKPIKIELSNKMSWMAHGDNLIFVLFFEADFFSIPTLPEVHIAAANGVSPGTINNADSAYVITPDGYGYFLDTAKAAFGSDTLPMPWPKMVKEHISIKDLPSYKWFVHDSIQNKVEISKIFSTIKVLEEEFLLKLRNPKEEFSQEEQTLMKMIYKELGILFK